jgi:hypothetical protein
MGDHQFLQADFVKIFLSEVLEAKPYLYLSNGQGA